MRHSGLFFTLALSIFVCQVATSDISVDPIEEMCLSYGDGDYPDVTSDSPLCSISYIHCNNGTYTFMKNLGNISTPYNYQVPAVFNAFSTPGGPALPGAIGTMACACDVIYAEDEITAKACKVCMALQLKGKCDPLMVMTNPSYSCSASVDEYPGVYFNCGLAGPFLQNGTAQASKATARVVINALGV